MSLTSSQIDDYRRTGHLTVPAVFEPALVDEVVADIHAWGESFLNDLPAEQRAWYIDSGVKSGTVLRKLDNPHAARDSVVALSRDPKLVSIVESILGPGVSVYFSQIFFKPPEGGGPKPAHQDNYYFGPSNLEGVVTAWIALDEATVENGCMYFGEGTNNGPVYEHISPPDEPFNLQLEAHVLARQEMTPAPVPKGGVSLHHGNTFHQSGPNHSSHWRRACALHYVSNETDFVSPALPYDHSLKRKIT